MNGKMYARDLMTRQVRTVNAESRLSEAIQIMDAGGYGQVPVMRDGRPVLLLTEQDALRAVQRAQGDPHVSEVASPMPCPLAPEAPLSEVLVALEATDAILIVGTNDQLEGIITYWDVLKVARPHLLVAETELLLRKVVAAEYEKKHGPDWWSQVPKDLRYQAEEEHHRCAREDGNSPEHMLGHTSMWSLIEIYHKVRPDLSDELIQSFHKVRVWRNQVAHLYMLDDKEIANLVRDSLAMRDFLEPPPSRNCPK